MGMSKPMDDLESSPKAKRRRLAFPGGWCTVHTDGASRGNPGRSSIGASVSIGGKEVGVVSEVIEDTTNNVAEYKAAIAGLRKALDLGAERVHLRCDSKLLVEQTMRRWRCQMPHLKPLLEELLAALGGFEESTIAHVRRAENKRADELCNLALDGKSVGDSST